MKLFAGREMSVIRRGFYLNVTLDDDVLERGSVSIVFVAAPAFTFGVEIAS